MFTTRLLFILISIIWIIELLETHDTHRSSFFSFVHSISTDICTGNYITEPHHIYMNQGAESFPNFIGISWKKKLEMYDVLLKTHSIIAAALRLVTFLPRGNSSRCNRIGAVCVRVCVSTLPWLNRWTYTRNFTCRSTSTISRSSSMVKVMGQRHRTNSITWPADAGGKYISRRWIYQQIGLPAERAFLPPPPLYTCRWNSA